MNSNKKYLRSGQMVEVIGKVEGKPQWIVSELLEGMQGDGDSHTYPSEYSFITNEIFDVPPTRVLCAEVKKLEEEAKRLQDVIWKSRQEIREIEEEKNKTLEKVKKYQGLEHIEDFIEGKITHYLTFKYGDPEIISFKDTFVEDNYSRIRNTHKLLTLFGNSQGNLSWGLNEYKDGSGSNTEVIPCISLEDAKEKAQQWLDVLDPEQHPSKETILFAKEYGLKLPDWYVPKYKNRNDEYNKRSLKELEEKLSNFKAQIENEKSGEI